MIAALLIAAALQESAPADAPREPAPAGGLAFVTYGLPRRVVLVNEPVEVALRFGFDLEVFEERLVQPFRQPLDVPASVVAPGWGAWADAIPRALDSAEEGDERFVLNDEAATAVRLPDSLSDGRRTAVFEVRAGLVPTGAGELVLAAPELRFVTTSGFEEDFLGELEPVDREDRIARGEPLVLEVRDWPVEDRPADFGGAVGRFTVAAEAAPRSLAVGDTLRLTLAIAGAGNFENLELPALEDLAGLHLLGRLLDRAAGRVTATYDLRVTDAALRAVPAITFPFLEPGPAPRYATATTERIELEVRGDAADAQVPLEEEPAPERTDDARSIRPWTLLLLALGPLGFWLGYRFGRRGAPAQASGARPTRVPASPSAASSGAAGPGPATSTDPLHRLAERLAARLGAPTPSVYDAGLGARLVRAGAPEPLARRAAGLFEAATAARYGGAELADAAAELDTLLADLDREWPEVSGTSPPAPR